MGLRLRAGWLLLLAALLAASAVAAPAPVTIRFWHAMRGVKGGVVRDLVARFNRENPDLHVEEKFIGSTNQRYGNDYHALYQAVLENLAEKTPPDVTQVYENWTTQLLDVGAIVPVQGFLGGPYPLKDVDDFVPVFREANTFNGQLCTLPFNKSIYVLYYNQALLPHPPRTLAELKSMARDVSRRHPGVWGLVFEPGVDIFGDLLYADGGTFFDPTGRAAFAQPAGVNALATLLDMTRQDRSAVASLDAEKLFTSGRAAMYVWSTTAQVEMRRDAHFPMGVAMLPMGTTRAYQFAGTNLAILARPDHQMAAWRLVRFLTSRDVTLQFAMRTGYLPVRLSAIRSQAWQDFVRQNPGFRVGVQALPYARIQPRVAAWESVRGILDDAVFASLSGKADPQDMLSRAAAQTDDLIRKLSGQP